MEKNNESKGKNKDFKIIPLKHHVYLKLKLHALVHDVSVTDLGNEILDQNLPEFEVNIIKIREDLDD